MTEQRIDIHHHIIPDRYLSQLRQQNVKNSMGRDFPEWSPDISLEMMERNDIACAVMSISSPGVYFGDTGFAADLARNCNEYMAETIQRYPGRFGGFATLPLPDTDRAAEEAIYGLDVLKLNGVALLTHYDGVYLGDPAFDDLFAELDKRHSVVYVHPTDPPYAPPLGKNVPNFFFEVAFETTRAVVNLVYSGTLERFPHLRFIFAHLAGTVPFLAWRLSLGALVIPGAAEKAPKNFIDYLRGIYYDTGLSASQFSLASVHQLAGSSKIVFGTDFPFAPEEIARDTIKGLSAYDGFTRQDLSAVERLNAKALLVGIGE